MNDASKSKYTNTYVIASMAKQSHFIKTRRLPRPKGLAMTMSCA